MAVVSIRNQEVGIELPDGQSIFEAMEYFLKYSRLVSPSDASKQDVMHALGNAVRNRLIDHLIETEQRSLANGSKRVHYLSMEFLVGRLLENNIINLQLVDECETAAGALGYSLEELFEAEYDPALGNGGLGRLAACFVDSMATLGIPGFGYGINYEFGLFRQKFSNGYQREEPDHWLIDGTPWNIERPNEKIVVPLYGRVENFEDHNGNQGPVWIDWDVVIGVPHDMPIAGYRGKAVNTLRLYSARSSDEFNMSIFNEGDYFNAVEGKISSERISKILYPEDSVSSGRELRLIQEYFLVSCAVQDIVRRHKNQHGDLDSFAEKQAIQLNDTHPALTVVELMRVLVDENGIGWDRSWEITNATCAYTNHTLLPEALETWPVGMVEKVIPRHMQIIREIDRRFNLVLEEQFPDDSENQSKLAVIGLQSGQSGAATADSALVRMASLSMLGCHSINGVAALHSELVKTNLAPEYHSMWPEKFNNKTNGVTPRRWLLQCNKPLANLFTQKIGSDWITNLGKLEELQYFADDEGFLSALRDAKLENKKRLAEYIHHTSGIVVDTNSMFDVQAKRIHEYKRQLLMALYITHLYLKIRNEGLELPSSRTFIFGGKAAPGYFIAKRIIKLINSLATIIDNDPVVSQQIKVIFLPDYKVSVAEKLMPAADLSEQISTAGFEASGTGNMKFSMNGALTVGTLDGANVEIEEEVGSDNIYIFGMTAGEVEQTRGSDRYVASEFYQNDPDLAAVIDALASGTICPDEPGVFEPIANSLMVEGDYFRVLGDFRAYLEIQEVIGNDYLDQDLWVGKVLQNIAHMGKFSSDRTISEYASGIWKLEGFE